MLSRWPSHLLDETTRDPGKARRSLPGFTSPRDRARLAIALGLAAAAVGAIVAGVSLAGRHASAIKPGQNVTAAPRSGSGVAMNPWAALPSMEYPLGKGDGQPVSLADAGSALGRPVALPDTAQMTPADVGAVYMNTSTGDGQKLVDLAISFPKQGMIIQYIQPPLPDPLANYQVGVNDSDGSLIHLNGGMPAFTEEGPLSDGSPWGFVEFVAGGSTILVMGHPDEATLQAAAQSIVDRIGPSS